MTPTTYHQFKPSIQNFIPKENGIMLNLKIEPWVFDTLQDFFPDSDSYDFQLIQRQLNDCISQFRKYVDDKIHSGTEIMIHFLDSILVFEVKNYTQSFCLNEIEETYILDLSKIEENPSN